MHGHDPARRPGGHPDSALSGRHPVPIRTARPASASAGRSPWLSMPSTWPRQRRLAVRFRPRAAPPVGRQPARRRRHPPCGDPQRTVAVSICPRHPPAGGYSAPQHRRQPDRQPDQPRSALRAGSPMARHAPMARSALSERPIMGCDTPSAPRAPLAGGRWRGVNAVCGGERDAPRDPRPPAPAPLSVLRARPEGGGTLHAPLWEPLQDSGGGGPGLKKIREMENWGEEGPPAPLPPPPVSSRPGGARAKTPTTLPCGTHS